MSMDFESFLRNMVESEMKKKEGTPFKNLDEAEKELRAFLDKKPDFEVGDRVERNDIGKNRYTFPKAGQVAICVETGIDDEEDIRIAVAIAKDNFLIFTVDSRYYQKGAAKSNIFKFGKKS